MFLSFRTYAITIWMWFVPFLCAVRYMFHVFGCLGFAGSVFYAPNMNIRFFKPSRAVCCFFFLLIAFSSFGMSCARPKSEWLDALDSAAQRTVLLNNADGLIPIKDLTQAKIASVAMGVPVTSRFDSVLDKYAAVKHLTTAAYDQTKLNRLSDDLKLYNTVILRVKSESLASANFREFINSLQVNKQVIVYVSGVESALSYFNEQHYPIIWSSKQTPSDEDFAAQLIFGGTAASGRLPKTVSHQYKKGEGYSTTVVRLKYTVPEEVGIKSADLMPIDDIVNEAIRNHVTPSAVVLVVKDGKVIFDKAYGTHTYKNRKPTSVDDIYDLASVSKITATTIAAMRLYEEHRLGLDSTLGTYFPLARTTNKNGILIRDLLLHQAGLIEYIPFHNSIRPTDHSVDSSAAFPVKVADNYFVRKDYYQDVMLPRMLSTSLRTPGKYVYSDLSMYFMKEAIEHITAEPLNKYVQDNFYAPLGMYTAGYLPRLRFDSARIIPTEIDTYFRKTLVQGYVHDQGAALAGGVAGHAGVFATANDLAILFQLFLNGGTYGGQRYFQDSTINLFTSRQSPVSRRGLGFDRYDPDSSNPYPSSLASPMTYGHTGFTGTCVWVDPKNQLIYMFLSNRLNDQPANRLSSTRVRPRIQDVIYRAINKSGF